MPSRSRLSALLCIALTGALASCGGSSDRQTPTVELPFIAQTDVDSIVTDFIEVCSQSLVDQPAAINMLSKRDWIAPTGSDLAQMAAMGGYMSEDLDGNTIQLLPIDFPHVQGSTCQVFGLNLDEMPDFSALEKLSGMQGEMQTLGFGDEAGTLGRYSGIGTDGYPLTVQLTATGDRFFNLSMTMTRPVKPSETNQE